MLLFLFEMDRNGLCTFIKFTCNIDPSKGVIAYCVFRIRALKMLCLIVQFFAKPLTWKSKHCGIKKTLFIIDGVIEGSCAEPEKLQGTKCNIDTSILTLATVILTDSSCNNDFYTVILPTVAWKKIFLLALCPKLFPRNQLSHISWKYHLKSWSKGNWNCWVWTAASFSWWTYNLNVCAFSSWRAFSSLSS